MKVRAIIALDVSDAQRVAIAAYRDGRSPEYDDNGHLVPQTGLRKASHAEVRDYAETYGWAGMEGPLTDVLYSLGLDR